MSSPARYTMMLDGPTVDLLARLQAIFGLGTRAAVFDLALVVLDWVATQQKSGYEVGRASGDNFQPLLLPYRVRTEAEQVAAAKAKKPRASTPTAPVAAAEQPASGQAGQAGRVTA